MSRLTGRVERETGTFGLSLGRVRGQLRGEMCAARAVSGPVDRPVERPPPRSPVVLDVTGDPPELLALTTHRLKLVEQMPPERNAAVLRKPYAVATSRRAAVVAMYSARPTASCRGRAWWAWWAWWSRSG